MPNLLAHTIQQQARALGFDLCRITPVTRAPHGDFFAAWVAAGRAGEMHYLARQVEKRRDPALLVEPETPPFRSLIALAVNHQQFALPAAVRDDPSRGIIASYAWGDDYHELIRPRLYELDAFIRQQSGRTSLGKALVDTGPVLERDWAMQAGLGFIGKNCCLIHPGQGSWLLLATLLVPEELGETSEEEQRASLDVTWANVTADSVLQGLPAAGDYGHWPVEDEALFEGRERKTPQATCGHCTRCLTACPTNAFVGAYHLEPQRCISYWTIESRQPIPRQLRPHFGNRIFGCDICQEVCPYKQRLAERTPLLAGLLAQATRVAPPLLAGFQPDTPYWLDQAAFTAHFRRSPVLRARRAGLLRNVCVALGNWGAPATLPALRLALHDPDPLPRGHAAWALGQLWRKHHLVAAQQALCAALTGETVDWVAEEIEAARLT